MVAGCVVGCVVAGCGWFCEQLVMVLAARHATIIAATIEDANSMALSLFLRFMWYLYLGSVFIFFSFL